MKVGETSDDILSFYKESINNERKHWVKTATPLLDSDWQILYHLFMFSLYFDISDNESFKVVEHRGGYGNTALFASKIFSNADYTIVDFKDNLNTQRIYLKDTNIKFMDEDDIDEINDFDCYLSIWGLSELKIEDQKRISSHWYGAKQIMLTYQKNCNSFYIENLENFVYIPHKLKGNNYVFGEI